MNTTTSQGLSLEIALQQAITHHQAGRLQEAEQLYRAILQVQAKHPDANHNLGVLAVQVKQSAAGLLHLKVALEANPKQQQYWLSYLDALIQSGRHDSARKALEQGKKFGLQGFAVAEIVKRLESPSCEEIEAMEVLFSQGRIAELQPLVFAMMERFPNHGVAWKILGAMLLQQGKFEDSLQATEKSAFLMPNDAEAHNNFGRSLQALGRFSDAEASFRQALLFKPDYTQAIKNLGNVFLAQKMVKKAVLCYEKALAIAPDYDEAHNNLGAVHFSLGNIDRAVFYYQKARELKSSSSGTLFNLGSALYQQGNIASAMDCFRKVLELSMDSRVERDNWAVDAAAYLAVLYYLEGDMPAAMQVVDDFKNEAVKGNGSLNAYFSYLNLLITSEAKVQASIGFSDTDLYVIGESHALPLHNVQVVYRGKVMTCRSRWILGCKQWHLGNDQANRFKYRFEAEMAQLPRQSTILLTIGEIDCRPYEGIIKIWKKSSGKSLDDIAQATAVGYVGYVAKIASQYGHQIIVGGVPAPHIRLNALTEDVVRQLVHLISVFNARLKDLALVAGMDFLDVYGLTNQGDGIADGRWHIDDYHLTSNAMVEAFNRHIS